MLNNGLIRKIIPNFKTYTSQTGKQTIAIHVLLNVSKKESNQTMKFGQSIGCNIKNIFLEKLFTKCDGETIPKLFSYKSKLSISLNL